MTDSPEEGKGGPQDQLRTTGMDDMFESWKKGKQVQNQMILNLVQYARSQDAPEAMEKLLWHQVTDPPRQEREALKNKCALLGQRLWSNFGRRAHMFNLK
jgi:hypothetical protein